MIIVMLFMLLCWHTVEGSSTFKKLDQQKVFHLASGWMAQTKKELNDALNQYINNAQGQYNAFVRPETIRALIVPHAGMSYSGTVAAGVYRLLKNAPHIKRIIILAVDHFGQLAPGTIALPSWNSYQLPNGTLHIDQHSIKKLIDVAAKENIIVQKNIVFSKEHSMEIQLPWLVRYAPQAFLVPIILGDLNEKQAENLANYLKEIVDEHTLIIVSTDFTHYGPFYHYQPFHDEIILRVKQLNSRAIETINDNKSAAFISFIDETNATICGKAPLLLFMALRKTGILGEIEPRLIAYDTSLSTAHNNNKNDDSNFVCYVGMLFTTDLLSKFLLNDRLTQFEKQDLYEQATKQLTHLADTKNYTLFEALHSFGLQQSYGAFVTLKQKNGSLRGCMGTITSDEPLYKTIGNVVQNAALHDPRFSPVKPSEVSLLDLSISILGPQNRTEKDNIVLGRDGIILKHDFSSALFLPEVATEQHWNISETLSALAQKAGLDPAILNDKKTTLYRFETIGIDTSIIKTPVNNK